MHFITNANKFPGWTRMNKPLIKWRQHFARKHEEYMAPLRMNRFSGRSKIFMLSAPCCSSVAWDAIMPYRDSMLAQIQSRFNSWTTLRQLMRLWKCIKEITPTDINNPLSNTMQFSHSNIFIERLLQKALLEKWCN